MQDTAPPPPASPPWPVRLVNGPFAGLESVGLQPLRFEPDTVRRLARKRAGLELDIEAPAEAEGLERLCRSLEVDAQLNLVGRLARRRRQPARLAVQAGSCQEQVAVSRSRT